MARSFALALVVMASVAPVAPAARASPALAADDGLWIKSPDGANRLHIGAFLQADARSFADDDERLYVDQLTFRSLRLQLDATLSDHVDVRVLPDFASGRVVIQDAYIDLRYVPGIKLRVGKQKIPFGYERLQNEGTTILAERGLPTQLAPNRDIGVALYGTPTPVLDWQLGVFDGVPDGALTDGDVSDQKELAARVLVRPLPCWGRWQGLALGGAATYGDTHGTVAAPDLPVYKTSGQTSLFQFPVGTTAADTAVADGRRWRVTAQGSWFGGPIGILAEYVRTTEAVTLGAAHGDVTAAAWQGAVQWVITGDDATYRSVVPREPFDPAKGHWGAVDVVARFDELNIEPDAFDAGLAAGAKSARRARGYTAGADWFWSRNVRLALDLERTTFTLGAKGGDRPDEDLILGRVQLAF